MPKPPALLKSLHGEILHTNDTLYLSEVLHTNDTLSFLICMVKFTNEHIQMEVLNEKLHTNGRKVLRIQMSIQIMEVLQKFYIQMRYKRHSFNYMVNLLYWKPQQLMCHRPRMYYFFMKNVAIALSI